jgi:hypothetical protein
MTHVDLIAVALLSASPLALQRPAAEEQFATLYAYIIPKQSELTWRTIGWRESLGQAWREARNQDKPILFWAMNGHPLGCT